MGPSSNVFGATVMNEYIIGAADQNQVAKEADSGDFDISLHRPFSA